MNQRQQLIRSLRGYPVEWINQYFNLVKKLLTELDIHDGDPRLVLSIRKDRAMPVNLGRRHVLRHEGDRNVGCIVPIWYAAEEHGKTYKKRFTQGGVQDASWIVVHYPLGGQFPSALYAACTSACKDILDRSKQSPARKSHVSLLYDFTMNSTVRSEILEDLKKLTP